MSDKMKSSFIMKHYNEILNDPMYKAMIKTGKVTRYQFKEESMVDHKFSLSIVSGITDVPAYESKGYFEVAIMVNKVTDGLRVQVIQAICDFEEVWKIQKKFRVNPYKMWERQLKKGVI